MLDTLLATKLYVPRTRPALVPRPRLLSRLSGGLERKLTLVVAPAGFGKTTLLSEWAGDSPMPLAWISLDEADNDPDRFLSYLVAALQAVNPSGNMGAMVLAMRRAPQPVSQESILTALINEMAYYGEPFIIVLDDYHLVQHQAMHDLMNYLLDYLPPNVHLVVAGRREPPLNLARLRARDQVNEFRLEDLRFNDAEMSEFLGGIMGLQLNRSAEATLGRRTEGWPAGLHLAALSLKGHQDPDRIIADWERTQRFVIDFLAAEVLETLPEEVQSFLLQISVLGQLSGPLCQAVTGRSDAGAMLERLAADDLFIFALDQQQGWYRLHRLFQDFLHIRLNEMMPGSSSELRRRAARWFVEHDLPASAIEYALAAGDHDLAADLMGPEVRKAVVRGEFTTIIRWVGELPDQTMVQHPNLGLARSWAILIRDPIAFWSHAREHLERLYRDFDLDQAEMPRLLANLAPDSDRRLSMCELALLHAFVARQAGDIQASIELFEMIPVYLPPEENFLRAISLAGLGSNYVRTGEVRRAEKAFGRAAEVSQRAGSIFGAVVSLAFEALAQSWAGHLRQAEATYRRALSLVPEGESGFLPLSGTPWIGLGNVLRERNDLQGALQLVEQGVIRGEQIRDIDALREGYVVLARTRQACGNEEGADRAMEKAEEIARQIDSPECSNEVAAWKARLDLIAGDLGAAAAWAAGRGMDQDGGLQLLEPVDELERMTLIRLLIAQGKYTGALEQLAAVQETAEGDGRGQSVLESQILAALCLFKSGRRQDALLRVARALHMAEPEGYVRLFLEEGPAMAALLRSARAEGHAPEYAGRLLAEFGEGAGRVALPDPLSERELEVLGLIYHGLTNQQIASNLTIAVSTVKTHINRIYSKLDVATRAQAIARARDLHLLD